MRLARLAADRRELDLALARGGVENIGIKLIHPLSHHALFREVGSGGFGQIRGARDRDDAAGVVRRAAPGCGDAVAVRAITEPDPGGRITITLPIFASRPAR